MVRDREPPAIRVYTVCDESRYLIVRNVPALGCGEELSKLFGTYGNVDECKPMDAEDCEPFTDVYWIKFSEVNNARFAKKKLDESAFLGNLLKVSYAPEYETLADIKAKLEGRTTEVLGRIKSGQKEGQKTQDSSSSENFNSSRHWLSQEQLLSSNWLQYPMQSFIAQQIIGGVEIEQRPILVVWHGAVVEFGLFCNIGGAKDVFPASSLPHIILTVYKYHLVRPFKSDYSYGGQASHGRHGVIAHVSSDKEYFPLPSMNETVRVVREKLDKIKSVGTESIEADQASKRAKVDNRRRI